MANIDFQPTKDVNRHNIAFLRYGDSLHFVVTNLNEPIISYDNRTDFVDKIIVDPTSNGKDELSNVGSVKEELSRLGVKKKLANVYSKEKTPTLFELTDGDFNKVNYETIRAAALNGDQLVNEIVVKALKLGAVLLNKLYYSTNPQSIVLHNLRVNEEEFKYLKREVAKIAGESVASKIDLSIIDKNHGFLSGCAIAIRELFFTRGGFDTAENVQ